MNTRSKQFLLTLGLLLVSSTAFGQAEYRLQPDSEMWIEGTSNQNDWTVYATEIAGSVRMDAGSNAVQQVHLTVPTEKVVGQKSPLMDLLIHNALKADAHPQIEYHLESAQASGPAGSDGAFTLETGGRLTLAGVTKPIAMTVHAEKMADGQVHFKGVYELLMTDYDMTPPSAMFGALKTGDEVTIHFDVVAVPASGP